ncbi:MAG: HTTM domain-containing protein [Chthoniobacterales bacterium]
MLTKEAGRRFFTAKTSDRWISILRIGLGVQIILFAWSMRRDWPMLFQSGENGTFLRAVTEAMLSSQTDFTPRLGWLIQFGEYGGLQETTVLTIVWSALFVLGGLLAAGLFIRPAAILGWFLYLCCVKSSGLFAYGVDNFTTIGLFYLVIAPLPDSWSLDRRRRKSRTPDPQKVAFYRRVLQLHLCLIYFFGGLSKSLGLDWWNGNSVWRALIRPPFDLVPPDLLVRLEYLLPFIGISVCLLETGYPVFIWLRRIRPFWLAGILLMHLSIGLTMGLYLFALIMITLNLAAFGSDLLSFRQTLSVRPRGMPGDSVS